MAIAIAMYASEAPASNKDCSISITVASNEAMMFKYTSMCETLIGVPKISDTDLTS